MTNQKGEEKSELVLPLPLISINHPVDSSGLGSVLGRLGTSLNLQVILGNKRELVFASVTFLGGIFRVPL